MPNQRYTYTGPNSAITVKNDDATTRDVMLWRNTEVELPDDDEHVVVMIEMDYLIPIGDAPPTATVVNEPPAGTGETPAGTGETPAVTTKPNSK